MKPAEEPLPAFDPQDLETLLRHAFQSAPESGFARPDTSHSGDATEPEFCGRFRLIEEIGRGGVGVVYRAFDDRLQRDVALKVLPPREGDGSALRRFIEEARVAARLQHPGVVPVHELGVDGRDRPFIAMKLVEGRTLAEVFNEACIPTERDPIALLHIFEAICQTMAFAHSHGVIHRDLKPLNIMVGAFGEVQVMDWGLAHLNLAGAKAEAAHSSESAQASLDICGTPAYMAPEQALGLMDDPSPRVDVFGLGAILCELLTGVPPIAGDAVEATRRGAVRGCRDAVEQDLKDAQVDQQLLRLTLRCLHTDPAERPASAAEVADEVQRYLSQIEARAERARLEAATARERTFAERRRRRLEAGLGAVLGIAILMLVGAAWWYSLHAADERHRQANEARAALVQAEGLANGAAWDAATAALRRARLLAVDSEDAGLINECDARLEVTLSRQQFDAEDRARRARDVAFLEHINGVMLMPEAAPSAGDKEFAAAFARFGLDIDHLSVGAAALQLRTRGRAILPQIINALDHWAARRSHLPARRLHLHRIAQALDGEPLRRVWRERLTRGEIDDLLTTARELEPADYRPVAIELLAQSLVWAGYADAACTLLRRAVEIHPGDPRLHMHLGTILGQTIDDLPRTRHDSQPRGAVVEEAYLHARVAHSLRPESPFVLQLLARVLRQRGDAEQALRHCETALERAPRSAVLHFSHALIARDLGDIERAFRALDQVFAHAPEHESGARLLIRLLVEDVASIRGGDPLELPHAKAGVGTLLRAAQAASIEGAFLDARRLAQRALHLAPTASAYRQHCFSLMQLGQYQEAQASLDAWRSLPRPSHLAATAQASLDALVAAVGRGDGDGEEPPDPGAWLRQAQALVHAGRHDCAAEIFVANAAALLSPRSLGWDRDARRELWHDALVACSNASVPNRGPALDLALEILEECVASSRGGKSARMRTVRMRIRWHFARLLRDRRLAVLRDPSAWPEPHGHWDATWRAVAAYMHAE